MQHDPITRSTWVPTDEEIVEHNSFLRLMAHDVRTPLNAILGFSELVVNPAFGVLTDQQREFIESIAAGARQLADLVPHVIELSEWPSQPNHDAMAIGNAIESVVAIGGRLGRKRQIDVDFSCPLESLKDEPVPKAFRRLLFLLIQRSVAACPAGAALTLTLSRTSGRSGLILTSTVVSEDEHSSRLSGWEALSGFASELGWHFVLSSDSGPTFEMVAAMDGCTLTDEQLSQ